MLPLLFPFAFAAPPAVTAVDPPGAQRGTAVTLTATGAFERWPAQLWCSDPAVRAEPLPEKGKFRLTLGPDAQPGVCRLRFHDHTGAGELRPFAVGTLPDAAEVEPNDDPTRAQPVAIPAVVNGRLAKRGDVDAFAVRLTKGRALVAALEANTALGSPMDAVLQVVSASGAVLDQNHDAVGLDPRLTFAAPADGVYLVRLFAFPSEPDSSIGHFGSPACAYRLTLTDGGYMEAFTPLAAEAGRDAVLTLHGRSLPAPTFRLPAGASRFDPPGVANGGAVIREPHPCPDLTASPPSEPLAPPFTATARVDGPAGVAIPFTASKGKALTIRLDAASVGSELTPVGRVVDASGKVLAKLEPAKLHADAEVAFAPPADGVFRVEVRDLHRAGGPRHLFRLRVAAPEPGFAPTVPSDRLTLKVGQPLDVAVTLNPKNGFAGEVKLSAEGFFPGVTAKPAGKSALRFEATEAGWRGPLRVVATDAQGRRVAATAGGSAELWMTVVGR